MLPTQIFKYSCLVSPASSRGPPSTGTSCLRNSGKTVRGESSSQGTHFIKSFLIPLPVSGGAVSPLHINPCRGDTVADIWDGNQETYFFGIECPLSSCTARIVGKPELLLLGVFRGELFQFEVFLRFFVQQAMRSCAEAQDLLFILDREVCCSRK